MTRTLWWLSFVDLKRPQGQQFLGIAIVEASDIAAATKVAWATNCNPGGSIKGMLIDPNNVAQLSFELPIGILLTPDESRELADRVSRELGD